MAIEYPWTPEYSEYFPSTSIRVRVSSIRGRVFVDTHIFVYSTTRQKEELAPGAGDYFCSQIHGGLGGVLPKRVTCRE